MSKERKISRREFLQVAGVAVGGLLLPPWLFSENKGEKTKKELGEVGRWVAIGPPVKVLPGEELDGIRAANSSLNGELIIAGTWHHGLWYKAKGVWQKFPDKNPSLGIFRQIITIEQESEIGLEGRGNICALIVRDNGLEIFRKEAGGEFDLEPVNLPEGFPLEFSQTGYLLDNGEILLGGLGGVVKVGNWHKKEVKIEVLLSPKDSTTGKMMMTRTIASSKKEPNVIFAGGWWEYSGWEKDSNGRILPGAGVWKSEKGGEFGSWRNVLEGVNVNCLFVHPENPKIVIAGTEGAGNQSNRKPMPEYPSLFISLDKGENWTPLTPRPWVYDLVTPQQAFFFDKEKQMLYISFWGGPTQGVFLPSNLSLDSLKSLKWVFLGDRDSKRDYHSGHLMGIKRKGELKLVTGSFHYWIEPKPPFTPLYCWLAKNFPHLD